MLTASSAIPTTIAPLPTTLPTLLIVPALIISYYLSIQKVLRRDYQRVISFELQTSNKKDYKHYFVENQYVNNFFFAKFCQKITTS